MPWLSIVVLTIGAILTANLTSSLRTVVSYGLIAALAGLVAMVRGDLTPRGAVLALVPASALVGSPLLPDNLQYAAVLASIGAGCASWLLRWPSSIRRTHPTRPITLFAGTYLSLTVLAALASDHRGSALAAAAGTVAVLALTLWVAPSLGLASMRRQVVGVIIVTTSTLAALSLALWVTGPIFAFGREVGGYPPNEIVWLHERTNIVVPRLSGVYGTPGYQSLAVMCGLIALVAMLPTQVGRRRNLGWAGVVLHVVALVFTMARGGWLGAALGLAVLVGINASRRTLRVAPVVVAVVFVGLLSGVTFSWLGTIDVSDRGPSEMPDRGQSEVPEGAAAIGDAALSRGGVQLESRALLWRASLDAIRARPLLGYGPGRDAPAIAPFIPGEYYDHLGSHSATLRVAVEIGIPGAFSFLALLAVALATMIVRARRAVADWPILAFAAIAVGLTASSATETLLLGGVAFPNLLWALAIGSVVAGESTGP